MKSVLSKDEKYHPYRMFEALEYNNNNNNNKISELVRDEVEK
jgi:hypothetical protein